MLRRLAPVLFWLCVASPAQPAPVPATKRSPEEKKSGETPAAPLETHKVKRGETLWAVARLHGVSVGDIMDLNHLTDANLRDGQILKIPPTGKEPALARTKATTHTIAKGETFRSIARRYGLTWEELEQANPRVDPDQPKAGTKLTIPATALPERPLPDKKTGPTGPRPSPAAGSFHTVSEGETYHSIAKKHRVTIEAIAAANPDVIPERLRPGMKLNLPPRPNAPRDKDADPTDAPPREPSLAKESRGTVPENAATPAPEDKPAPKTRRYIVSADETPQTISEAFEISLKRLYEMNGLKPGTPLKAGMEIQVPLSPGGVP